MTTNLKRFTVSIPPEIEKKLDIVKKEKYYRSTQSDMIRGLITLGLKSIEKENMN